MATDIHTKEELVAAMISIHGPQGSFTAEAVSDYIAHYLEDNVPPPTPPGGVDTNLQYNDGGAFGGIPEGTYNKATGKLTYSGELEVSGAASFTGATFGVSAVANFTGTSFGVSSIATFTGELRSPGVGANSFKAGVGASAAGGDSVALGDGASAVSNSSVVLGRGASGYGGATIVGKGANGSTFQSYDTVFGFTAASTAGNGCTYGAQASNTADGGMAMGRLATNSGTDGIAIGNNANVTRNQGISIGAFSDATGTNSPLAIGYNAQATGNLAHVVGTNAIGSGQATAVFGQSAICTADYCSSFGRSSGAAGQYSSAFGAQTSVASAIGATALGASAYIASNYHYSMALGYGAQPKRANQAVFGSSSNPTSPGSFQTFELCGVTNNAGAALTAGDVVVPSGAKGLTGSTTDNEALPMVLRTGGAAAALLDVAISGLAQVYVLPSTVVAIGDKLVASGTAKTAKVDNTETDERKIIGWAWEAKTTGASRELTSVLVRR